jgi:imidazole glycerol phosphate synthase subunit HisF
MPAIHTAGNWLAVNRVAGFVEVPLNVGEGIKSGSTTQLIA